MKKSTGITENEEFSGDFERKRLDNLARLVQSEQRRLEKIMSDMPDAQRKVAKPLVVNLAWQKVKLDEARKALTGQQIVIPYDNGGGQTGIREHPGFVAYNKLFTTFQRGLKQLIDLLPQGTESGDELLSFLEETRM